MSITPVLFKRLILLLVGLFFCSAPLAGGQANPFVHRLFSNDMVLQRDSLDPVWGWTTPGTSVTVAINNQSKTAVADASGRWQVEVGPFPAGGPYTLQVSAPGTPAVTFTNILFGDVFLCSGQSNMEFTVNGVYNGAAEIADSVNYPNIRCFTVPKVSALTPQDNLSTGNWRPAGASTTASFSAVAYFMAREMYKQNNAVPIGIVASAWGGTAVQSWVKRSVAMGIADLTQTIFDQEASGVATADTICGHYNGLIHPLAAFKFKAAIWYQGEMNSGHGQQYQRLLPGMFSCWRELFGANFPFVVVQLASVDGTDGWAEIREAQEKTVAADQGRSRLVTSLDIGEGLLHPLNKQDVGLRASWAMRNLVYNENLVNAGPVLSGSPTVQTGKLLCTFAQVGGGLMVGNKNAATPLSPVQEVTGGTLAGFEVAGSDLVFRAATAAITGANTVLVSSPDVVAPLYVRYDWANYPHGNLYAKVTDGTGRVVNGLAAGSLRNYLVYKLSANAAGSDLRDPAAGARGTLSATVPAGQVFHHWSGDIAALAGAGTPTTVTLTQLYVSIRAQFQIVAAPALAASPEVGRNVVSWTPLDPVVHYNVKRATAPGGPFTTLSGNIVGQLRYEDTAIEDGVTYYYTVSAMNEVGEGPAAAPLAVKAIAYVHGVQAVAGAATVAVSWQALPGATSYNVARATASGGPYETIAPGVSGTGYTDRALAAGQAYYYVVSANTPAGITPVGPQAGAEANLLPAPFSSRDVGTVGLAGSATVSGGVFTIKGSGADIAGAKDAFRFVYAPVTGDCTLTVRVPTIENTSSFARAGLMLRATLDADSPYAFIFRWGNQTNASSQYRLQAGAGPVNSSSSGANSWLRVVRAGNVFTNYTSPNGATWTQMGAAQTIALPATLYAGLVVCAHDDTRLNTSVFDNLSGLALQPVSTPQGLVADVRASDASVVLRWNAAAGATGYPVKHATTAGGPYTTVATVTGAPRYAPLGLTEGPHYFVVAAATGVGESADSAPVTVIVPALAGVTPVPTAITVTPGNGQIRLAWSGSAKATSFTVKRAPAIDGAYTAIGTFTDSACVDTGLANETPYYYVVAANAPGGTSANSAPVQAVPRYATRTGSLRAGVNSRYVSAVGAAPLIANQTALSANQYFELLDLGAGLTALRSIGNGRYVTVASVTTPLQASATAIGTSERYTLQAVGQLGGIGFKSQATGDYVSADNGGNSPLIANRTVAGSFETFFFIDIPLLKSPVGLNATSAAGQVSLRWNVMAGATNYVVARAATFAGAYQTIATVTGTTYADTTVPDGQTYYYLVSAANATTTSKASDIVGGSPLPAGAAPLNRAGWVFSASVSPPGNAPANAGDGDIGTRWSTGGAQVPGQWFRVDMGGACTIEKIVLDAGSSTNDSPRGYQVHLSNDGVNWGNPVATGTGTVGVTTIELVPQTVRYFRITQTGSTTGNYWSIHEIQVQGTPMDTLDRTGWIASASVQPAGNGPANALDGSGTTRWSTGGAQAGGQFFQVDMGAPRTFSQIVLDAGSSANDYPRGYQVFVSNDGVNWGSAIASGTGSATLTTIRFSTRTARYIRVVQTGATSGTYWSIQEFYVESAAGTGGSFAPAALPSPWQTQDIGAVAIAGSASYLDPTYSVAGSGADITGAADAFRYAYQAASGDCSLVVRLTSQEVTNSWVKAGIMLRETNAPGSVNAALLVSSGATNFQWRATTGGATQSAGGGWSALPVWLKLTRTGNAVAAFKSADGAAWTQIGTTQTLPLAAGASLGLAVTSHNNAVTSTATYDNATLIP